jgi:hypothetical protein
LGFIRDGKSLDCGGGDGGNKNGQIQFIFELTLTEYADGILVACEGNGCIRR